MNWAEEAFAPIQAERRRQIAISTWGHLAPRKNKKYDGEMVFALTEYGDYALISARWSGLPDSPWLFDAMMEFVARNAADREGVVLRFSGFFRNYQFVGTVTEVLAS